MDGLSLTFQAVAEPQPGARWQARFEALWPAYRRWFECDGDAARPSYAVARRMLRAHMPELVPTWERLVDLAGGGGVAARMGVLARLPVQASYNLTIADRSGDAVTACIAPDRTLVRGRAVAATNHQLAVEWPEHARATRSVERERRMLALLADPTTREGEFLDAFLEPPLYSRAYASGFGTLYTAVHRSAEGAVEYRSPGLRWRQSFDRFEEGIREVALYAGRGSAANATV